MKDSKFLIVGGLVVAGVIANAIYKQYCSAKESYEASPSDVDDASPKQKNNLPLDSSAKPTSDIYETKEAVITSVQERHYEAAKIMEESLRTIFKENDETIATETSDTLNQTSRDLKDLLK